MNAQTIIDFWFGEENKKCWFNASPEMDRLITLKYASLWASASRGELNQWREESLSSLALVIILDQFPLNMFRGKPESFSTEAASRDIARYAIDKGFDNGLNNGQKLFMYLPFMHSENLQDQETSIELFSHAGMDTQWARHHRDIVSRFGRFPHRNTILGRKSTQSEIDWLNSDAGFKG